MLGAENELESIGHARRVSYDEVGAFAPAPWILWHLSRCRMSGPEADVEGGRALWKKTW